MEIEGVRLTMHRGLITYAEAEKVLVRLKLTSASAVRKCLIYMYCMCHTGEISYFLLPFPSIQENSFPLHWRGLLLGLGDTDADRMLFGFQREKHLASNKHWDLRLDLHICVFQILKHENEWESCSLQEFTGRIEPFPIRVYIMSVYF